MLMNTSLVAKILRFGVSFNQYTIFRIDWFACLPIIIYLSYAIMFRCR